MKLKKLIPNDFRDFLSILSFVGFIAIVLEFIFNVPFLTENMTALFLILGGIGLMVVGKVFNIHKWARDGIQKNETSQLFTGIFGTASLIVGVILLFGGIIPNNMTGLVGALAIFPAIYILFDYLIKN